MNKQTQQHWNQFAEFCKWELASGGPDPQIKMVGEMSKNKHWKEKVWRAGCYISVYNVPFAEIIWQNWSWDTVNSFGIEPLGVWLEHNWSKIVTRVERKTVRRPEWMYEYFSSYYAFMENELDNAIFSSSIMDPKERYLFFWELTISNIKRYGRYVALKLLESYRQFCGIELVAPDIRPKDGWSPRITLGVLHPRWVMQMNDNNNMWNELVNNVVEETRLTLLDDYGIDVNLFQLQVMLCEYRESYHSKKQYPGRSLDSELGYANKAKVLWGNDYSTSMFTARESLFPYQHLGETCGWLGTRKECGKVLADYGYTWTDLQYSYNATIIADRFSNPVRWDEA